MSLEELESYFEGIALPQKIELVKGVMIEDVPLFLESHFNYLRKNGELKSADVFLMRLNMLHDKLEDIQDEQN